MSLKQQDYSCCFLISVKETGCVKKGITPLGDRHISIATGRLVKKIILQLVGEMISGYPGLETKVYDP